MDINRLRIWKHDRLMFDAEFLDSEFGSNRYRVSAFKRGTWLYAVTSTLMLQLREEGDAIRLLHRGVSRVAKSVGCRSSANHLCHNHCGLDCSTRRRLKSGLHRQKFV